MKKLLNALLLLALAPISISAQVALSEWQHEGFVITKKGKEQGIIWLNGADETPWRLQKQVLFLPQKKYEKAKKLKRKDFEKYSPKEILGYEFEDRLFVSRKYSAGATVSFKGLATRMFLEVLTNGPAKALRYYETPPSVGNASYIDEEREKARNFPTMLIQVGDEKLKSASSFNFYEFLDDCPVVYEKYETGGYGFTPRPREGKKKGLRGLINKALSMTGFDYVPELIADYNNECGETEEGDN